MNTAQLALRAADGKANDQLQPQANWLAFAQDWRNIVAAISGLSVQKRQLFEALVRLAGPLPFDLSKLESWHRLELPAAYINTLLPELVQLGLVARLRKTWGERIYFIPSDIYETVLYLSLEPSAEAWGRENETVYLHPLSGTEAIEAGEGASLAIFRFARLAAGEGISITAKGALHKKQLQRMCQEIEWNEEQLNPLYVQHPYAEAMPKSVALVLDMLLRLDLLRKSAGGYDLVTETTGAWLQRPLSHWRRVVYELTAEHYIAHDVRSKHIVYALSFAAGKDTWQSVNGVLASLQQYGWLSGDKQSSDVGQHQYAIEWLRAAHTLGLCDVGNDAAGECWYRWLAGKPKSMDAALTSDSKQDELQQVQPQGCFFIQPDFELLLLPESSYLVRWELETIGERAATAPMMTYRLTRESCHRAIEQQRGLEWQLQFLERYAVAGVPENVRDALERWASQCGQTQFAEVVLLRAADEQVAKLITTELSSDSSLVLIPIGPQDFIIERGQADLLRKKLEQLGLAPLKRWQAGHEGSGDSSVPIYWHGEHATNGLHRDADSAADPNSTKPSQQGDELGAKGMVYSPSALQYYEMDTPLTEEDVSAQFRQLPAMWTSSLRTYHASTLRELVSTAIQLQLPLQIDDERCGSMTVLPLRIVTVDSNSWNLAVEQRMNGTSDNVLIAPGTWKGVRMMLPDWLMS